MARAIELAHLGERAGEIPVGAVVVHDGVIIGEGHNRSIGDCDPSAHAEMVAIRAAARRIGNYRLSDCTLYVTLEPCPMCFGAVIHARIRSLYFGAYDPKGGVCGSVLDLGAIDRLNPHCRVEGGIEESKCAALLSNYFRNLRLKKREAYLAKREDALRNMEEVMGDVLVDAKPRHYDSLAPSLGLRLTTWIHQRSQTIETAAPRIVCIPGAGQWSALFSFLFSSFPTSAIVSVDLPGHGCGDATRSGAEFSPTFQQDVLLALLDSFGSGRITFICYGAACPLTLSVAMQRRDRVTKVILINPAMGITDQLTDPTTHALPRSSRQLERCLKGETNSLFPDLFPAIMRPILVPGRAKALLRCLPSMQEFSPVAVDSDLSLHVLVSSDSMHRARTSRFLRQWNVSASTQVLSTTLKESCDWLSLLSCETRHFENQMTHE